MRIYKLVMSVVLLFSITTVMGQQKPSPSSQAPIITKGYYAIGNNAQKLGVSRPLSVKPVSITGAEFNKGYYSIGKNRQKLPSEAGYIPVSTRRPVATKGYYSIGNNAEKLKN
jgi:hypothetical protein